MKRAAMIGINLLTIGFAIRAAMYAQEAFRHSQTAQTHAVQILKTEWRRGIR